MPIQIGPSPLEAFQVGTQLRGPTALGQMAMALTQRAMDMQKIREEARVKGDVERELIPLKAKAEVDAWKGLLGGVGGPGGGVITETRAGPFTIENPNAKAQVGAASKLAERQIIEQAEMRPVMGSVTEGFKELNRLGKAIPRPQAGLGRFVQGAQTAIRGATQELPQVEQYKRQMGMLARHMAKVAGERGARLSDYDAQQVLAAAFPDPIFDTAETYFGTFTRGMEQVNAQLDNLEITDMEGNPLMGDRRNTLMSALKVHPLEILTKEEYVTGLQARGFSAKEIEQKLQDFRDQIMAERSRRGL